MSGPTQSGPTAGSREALKETYSAFASAFNGTHGSMDRASIEGYLNSLTTAVDASDLGVADQARLKGYIATARELAGEPHQEGLWNDTWKGFFDLMSKAPAGSTPSTGSKPAPSTPSTGSKPTPSTPSTGSKTTRDDVVDKYHALVKDFNKDPMGKAELKKRLDELWSVANKSDFSASFKEQIHSCIQAMEAVAGVPSQEKLWNDAAGKLRALLSDPKL